jgi:hypothetical protein
MTGASGLLIKLGVRLVVFGLAFYIAARRNPKVVLPNKWATPLIALVFAVLNTALYWALTPILNLATLGALGFAMPFVVNLVLLLATVRIFQARKWIQIEGTLTTLWMSAVLTGVHGLVWVALDYFPNR